jgi:hypothetical protein
METIVEIVTPQRAAEYLDRNCENRPLRKMHIKMLAQEMKQGNWQCTHQGIAFNDKNILIDGQHRLHAIVLADTPVEMQVTRGIKQPDHLSLKIDLAARRSAADLLKVSPRVVSVVRVLAMMMNGWLNVSTSKIEECLKVFGEDAERICSVSSTKIAILDMAPVKAAAIAMSVAQKSDHPFEAMARLKNQLYEQMTPVEHAFCKVCIARSYDSKNRYQAFARSLAVFDKHNTQANRVHLSETRFEEAKQAVIAKMKEAETNGN